MTDFVDYDQLLDDVVSLLQTHAPGFKLVKKNMSSKDVNTSRMPFCDVRLSRVLPEVSAGNNYYVGIVVELEIGASDLSSKGATSTIVLDLLNVAQRAFVEHPRFSATWDASILGPVDIIPESEENVKDGAFMSGAIAQVMIFRYSNAA